MKTKNIIFSILFALVQIAWANDKIVGGDVIPNDHPGKTNTVALIKSKDGKIFCSGSLIGLNVVATAKHCLIDKKPEEINIFFGDDTDSPDLGEIRKVIKMSVRHAKDWEMMFPSFDVAYVVFEGPIPENFFPLPILSSSEKLYPGMVFDLVGHGNSSNTGSLVAGKKFKISTILKEFRNDSRFFAILVFDGEKGKGSCHGDSGGPAYTKIDGQWYVTGVTNGFDLLLTPLAMSRSNDPDFPFNVRCDKNQSAYSFLGSHGEWIEQESQEIIFKDIPFTSHDRVNTEIFDMKSWCESKNFGSPEWNMLKLLIDQKVDQDLIKGQVEEAQSFYRDCSQISNYLNSLESIKIDGSSMSIGEISFSPLRFMERLSSVEIKDINTTNILWEGLNNTKVKKLILSNLKLQSLPMIIWNELDSIELSNIVIEGSLFSKWTFPHLSEFSAYNSSIFDVNPLSMKLNLSSLKINNKEDQKIIGLETLPSSLKTLSLNASSISDASFIKLLNELQFLELFNGKIQKLDIGHLTRLTQLQLRDLEAESFYFGNYPQLEQLVLKGINLKDISSVAQSLNLASIDISQTEIDNILPLSQLPNLIEFRAFRSPLQKNPSLKNEANCPTNGNQVIATFCRK
ncbi:MAG: hypothetical protein Fur0010_23740 [Bdellovibrio sp.]